MSINERIKKMREHLGLKQKEFTQKISIANGTQSLIETGRRNPSKKYLQTLVNFFGVSLNWLTTGKGRMFAAAKPDVPKAVKEPKVKKAKTTPKTIETPPLEVSDHCDMITVIGNIQKQIANLEKRFLSIESAFKRQEDIISQSSSIIQKLGKINKQILELTKK